MKGREMPSAFIAIFLDMKREVRARVQGCVLPLQRIASLL